ncbi:MAG: hypothetical protein R2838_03430 [Caldilineaceae bacterium]
MCALAGVDSHCAPDAFEELARRELDERSRTEAAHHPHCAGVAGHGHAKACGGRHGGSGGRRRGLRHGTSLPLQARRRNCGCCLWPLTTPCAPWMRCGWPGGASWPTVYTSAMRRRTEATSPPLASLGMDG